MASEDSNFDLQTLLADAQDLEEESFVARALLQPETNPWESFPLSLLYPTEDPFNEIHYSLLCDPPADSLPATEVNIKTEPVDEAPFLQSEPELAEYLHFTHDDSDSSYPDTNPSPASVSPSSSPTETAPLLQPEPELAEYLCFPDQLDYLTTVAIVDSNSFSVTDTSPTTTISLSPPSFTSFSALTAGAITAVLSPSSPLPTISSSSSSELSSSNAPSINTEEVPCSTVVLDGPAASKSQFEEPKVHYTFVDPHDKPRKRRTKGIKNSTPIACTFCRRRKIRCGGPQEGGTCKSCIRLNHKGECVFPAVSYRGQRLGDSNSKRKPTSKSKSSGQCALPSSEPS